MFGWIRRDRKKTCPVNGLERKVCLLEAEKMRFSMEVLDEYWRLCQKDS